MEKKRIKYYDVLRILSFAMVILYHMLIQLYINDSIVPLDTVARYFQSVNMHTATLAVALFFMLSGAGLTIGSENSLSLKKYYKGRFFRLLVPFYLVVLGYYAVTLVMTGSMPAPFLAGTPAWRYVFTPLGLDEWLSMHGYASFSVGVGEWFLGALIILTALFPLLRYCVNRWPRAFFCLCTCVYVYVIYNYTSPVAMHMNLLLKGYEFVLGMYFAKYCKQFSVRWQMAAAPLVVFFFTSDTPLNVNSALKITLSALCVFVAVSALEPLLQKRKLAFLAKAQQFSYPLFLVHHLVIYKMTPLYRPYHTGKLSLAVFFLIEIAIMVALAIVVKFVSDRVIRLLDRRPKTEPA